jgi:methylphosphotriester-DNA--protein-cysteine methyltransferase
VRTHRPLPTLRDRVAAIVVVESDGGDSAVLPSTSVVLGVQFRGRVRAGESLLAPAGVTGIQPTVRTYSYAANTGSLLVRFTPEGAACLGVPVSELAGRSVALDDLLPRALVAELHERLGEAPDDATRIAAVERVLAELPYLRDPVVARAVAALETATGDASVAAVALGLGTSERQLERRFLARVGITPKRFAVLRRFERALALGATRTSLTAVAIEAGYYDQSHFIRDFSRFAGVSPGGFFGRR